MSVVTESIPRWGWDGGGEAGKWQAHFREGQGGHTAKERPGQVQAEEGAGFI